MSQDSKQRTEARQVEDLPVAAESAADVKGGALIDTFRTHGSGGGVDRSINFTAEAGMTAGQ